MKKIFKAIFLGIIFSIFPIFVFAAPVNETREFFVQPEYDLYNREKITAVLRKETANLYFYVDSDWLGKSGYSQRQELETALHSLGNEFYYKIYPELTAVFGSEWRTGIDGDEKITILIHPMKESVRGYFNSGDEYSKLQYPKSNEKEMLYLDINSVFGSLAKSYLAHEFAHLITFNQKERIFKTTEETWLNEARAEYAPTLLGYDQNYEKSNLKNRVEIFLQEPFNSLTEWQGQRGDYGALNLFTQYLVEQYGVKILSDSLKSDKTGIASINFALKKNGYTQSFSDVFTDWTISVLVNDCSLSKKYCYQNKDLKNIHITPVINLLPLSGESNLEVVHTTKNWAGNWFQFMGGQGTLKIGLINYSQKPLKIPYLMRDFSGNFSVGFLKLSGTQTEEILVSGFGKNINAVIILPSVQDETMLASEFSSNFSYFCSAARSNGNYEPEPEPEENVFPDYLDKPISTMGRDEIWAKIMEIEKLLTALKNQFAKLTGAQGAQEVAGSTDFSCQAFAVNLSFGAKGNQVSCLQEALKSQGAEIYPEGLVTGYFGTMTQAAVIRFQEKYGDEILAPWGLASGTGFVGATTREKLNSLLGE